MTLDLEALAKLPALVSEIEKALVKIQETPASPADPDRLLLTVPEAARLTGIKTATLYDYTSARKIPFVKLDRGIFFDPVDLKAWIEARKVPALYEFKRTRRNRGPLAS